MTALRKLPAISSSSAVQANLDYVEAHVLLRCLLVKDLDLSGLVVRGTGAFGVGRLVRAVRGLELRDRLARVVDEDESEDIHQGAKALDGTQTGHEVSEHGYVLVVLLIVEGVAPAGREDDLDERTVVAHDREDISDGSPERLHQTLEPVLVATGLEDQAVDVLVVIDYSTLSRRGRVVDVEKSAIAPDGFLVASYGLGDGDVALGEVLLQDVLVENQFALVRAGRGADDALQRPVREGVVGQVIDNRAACEFLVALAQIESPQEGVHTSGPVRHA